MSNVKAAAESEVTPAVTRDDENTTSVISIDAWDSMDPEVQESYRKFGITPEDIQRASILARELSLEQAKEIMALYLKEHGSDMLIPSENTDQIRMVYSKIALGDKVSPELDLEARTEAALIASNSVYKEVRAVYPPEDDMDVPCGTLRAWFLGLIWSCGLAGLNQFFSIRQPSVTVTVYLAQMFSFIMAKFMERTLPSRVFFAGSRFAFTLNPGPFNQKEHMLITIMSNVTVNVPSITPLFFVQSLDLFLGQEWARSYGYQFCMLICAQMLGFGLAGICRRYVVYPANMVWYFTLPQGSLNKALHHGLNLPANGWKISQFNFFFIAFGCMFCYYWLPNTIFPTLTFFNWISWIRPHHAVLSIITGSYYYNLGLTPFSSFDWNWFTTIDPLVTPFFILLQIVIFMIFWAVCVIIPTFFTNIWWVAYLPINSWLAYDNTGATYNITRVLNDKLEFNQAAYEAYSPIFLPASRTLRYAAMCGVILSTVSFSTLWYRKQMMLVFKSSLKLNSGLAQHSDIHSKLMAKYNEVPEWAFFLITLFAGSLGFAGLYGWPTGVSGWIIPFCFVISSIFVVPIAIIVAITAYLPTLEILFEIIGGYIFAGHALGYMIFYTLGTGITSQTIFFVQDMKLGHYAKIPPRTMVSAQIVATIVSSTVILGIVRFQLTGIPNVCDETLQLKWICSSSSTMWSSALQWSLVGSKKLFNAHTGMYRMILWAFPIGLLWPVPWYLARKRWPNSFFRYCHPAAMLVGALLWAPLNFSNVWQALPISWIFGVFVKARYLPWWSKYTYVLSSALTAGIAFSALIQFFAIDYSNAVVPEWWGSTQYYSTCDFQDCRYMTVAEGETFGPKEWH